MSEIVGMKIEELLSLEMFKEAKVLSGSNGLKNLITKVNVMEVPDVMNWLKKGEFILTTGYSIKDDVLKLNKMIPEMKKIGVSGMGIKTKRYIDDLPSSVLETAQAHAFPIIDMPLALSYGDVITKVLSDLVNKQGELLQRIDGFNGRLTEIMLRGGDIKEISEAIHNSLDLPIAIIENVFNSYEISADPSFHSQAESMVHQIMNKKAPHRVRKNKFYKVSDDMGNRKIDRIMIPINSEDRNYGYVVIWDLNKSMTEMKVVVIEAATSLIALNLVKKLSVFENENKHRIEFIEELLSKDEQKQAKALEKAVYFDFNKNLKYGIVVVAINEIVNQVKFTPNNKIYMQRQNDKLVAAVEMLKRHHKGKVIYGNKSDRIIMLVGFTLDSNERDNKAALLNICKDLMLYTDLENLKGKIAIGLGRIYQDYKALHKSYREAQRAVRNIIINKNNGSILHFDELGIYRILSYEALQPELEQFHNELLGPLIAYDQEKHTELLSTLKYYFKCGCNVKKVSIEMYTHYNTVIYRLQRIKEIGQFDLDDPETALNIHIALKISDILKTL